MSDNVAIKFNKDYKHLYPTPKALMTHCYTHREGGGIWHWFHPGSQRGHVQTYLKVSISLDCEMVLPLKVAEHSFLFVHRLLPMRSSMYTRIAENKHAVDLTDHSIC